MTENGGVELVGKTVLETEESNLEGQQSKPTLNRSVSCGSILQGNGMNKMKNLSRRVSFPSDDKLISGYNEPKNPWEHAHGTTTEDLIQAYTQACQQWNVRPITKLLLQLQEITDFTVRANSLTLKGEKLEMRVVETLESIFKRVQFITIDLEATNLDEDAGASLFDMIEYYESAVNVLVGFNKNLGNRGWQAAAHMMRKMSCLRLFDGHSVPLSIQASPFVGRALRLSNTLVTLHLENAMLSGRPLLLIVAALRMNTTLRELFLADNRFSPLDALQIANLLKFNRILQLLDIRNNPIQDMGLGHLCAGLMAQSGTSGLNGPTGGLNTLVLWNNQVSHEGMAKLAMALRYTVSLSTLNLGQNVLGDDGILRLKEGLLQNHSLLRLGLVGTRLTDEGAVAIAEYLAESPRIIRLDLRNNDIRVAGLMALSLAFKINNSLLRLDIDKPNKKDSLKELAAKQESLLNDMVSYAARNKQTALEKAQAAQQRLEEMRRAEISHENGLRYMDMTNASTSTASAVQTSSNNSNNQNPGLKSKGQELKGLGKKPNRRPIVTMSPDTDDTPEDSPEFLPRSSVSYHQVSPVMLSNSEIAKRAAAAAKLEPVKEHHEDNLTPMQRLTAISKLVDDVSAGANVMQTQPSSPDKAIIINHAVAQQGSSENTAPPREASQGEPSQCAGPYDGSHLPQDDLVSEDSATTPRGSSAALAPGAATGMENSNATVKENTTVPHLEQKDDGAPHLDGKPIGTDAAHRKTDETPTAIDAKGRQSETLAVVNHLTEGAVVHENDEAATPHAVEPEEIQSFHPEGESHSEQLSQDAHMIQALVAMATESEVGQPSSGDAQPTPAAKLENDLDVGEDAIQDPVSMTTESKSEDEQDLKAEAGESDGVQADNEGEAVGVVVSMATESGDEKVSVTDSERVANLESNNARMASGEASESRPAESMKPGSGSEDTPDLLGQTSPDRFQTASTNHEQAVSSLDNINAQIVPPPAVVVETKRDIDDVTTEESSGFENGAEDNSIQSGNLSPMSEDEKGGFKLLTPDSGIMHFVHAGPGPDLEKPINVGTDSERNQELSVDTEKQDLGNEEICALKSKLQTSDLPRDVQETPSGETPNMILELGQNISSQTHEFEHGDFRTDSRYQNGEFHPKTVENLSTCNSICTEVPKVSESPCEVEVSHFDLSKFPSGD